MPRYTFSSRTRRSASTDPQPPAQPDERPLTGPLSWTLGGGPQPNPKPAPGAHERRREPVPSRPMNGGDVRRRHNPSSRFRG